MRQYRVTARHGISDDALNKNYIINDIYIRRYAHKNIAAIEANKVKTIISAEKGRRLKNQRYALKKAEEAKAEAEREAASVAQEKESKSCCRGGGAELRVATSEQRVYIALRAII